MQRVATSEPNGAHIVALLRWEIERAAAIRDLCAALRTPEAKRLADVCAAHAAEAKEMLSEEQKRERSR